MENIAGVPAFSFQTNQQILFGEGRASELPGLIDKIGSRVLIVHGAASLASSPQWETLLTGLKNIGIRHFELAVSGEPSPESVDMAAEQFRAENVHCVVSIGGGSAIDTGKAVSAMIPRKESVEDFLEGVGKKRHDGVKVPFIAVPTTAGTGSEATKNAVISRTGKNGYKKSLRHDNLVPDIALLDPGLTLSCPFEVSAACGLDALTQLLEAYVSEKSSPLTDALALSGLQRFARGFPAVLKRDPGNAAARSDLLYAAYLSGVTLANAGLGVVHGIAGVIGGLYEIPHGVLCGTLLAAAVKKIIMAIKNTPDKFSVTSGKYANAGRVLSGLTAAGDGEALDVLSVLLEGWVRETGLPRLSEAGVKKADLERITAAADNKQSAVKLTAAEMMEVMEERF